MSDLDSFFREEKLHLNLPDESDEDYLARRQRTRFVVTRLLKCWATLTDNQVPMLRTQALLSSQSTENKTRVVG